LRTAVHLSERVDLAGEQPSLSLVVESRPVGFSDGAADRPVLSSDFDTCFQNLLSNQTLLGRQKVLGTTKSVNSRFRHGRVRLSAPF
jgi:hypothetical protein